MSGRPRSAKTSPLVRLLQDEVKQRGITGYGLMKSTGLPLRTVQRFLGGQGSPTISTVETIAASLDVVIEIRRLKGQRGNPMA